MQTSPQQMISALTATENVAEKTRLAKSKSIFFITDFL
ncbi:hypothetical protein EJP617_30020 [Erwinia sp. Ejp617]|nr:hypothetical protein EJP617_30020 [Erwinia sp. Ejp617]